VLNQPKSAGISAKNSCDAKIGEDGREAMQKWWGDVACMFGIQQAKKGVQ
jgi:hypothetical protein